MRQHRESVQITLTPGNAGCSANPDHLKSTRMARAPLTAARERYMNGLVIGDLTITLATVHLTRSSTAPSGQGPARQREEEKEEGPQITVF